MTLVGSARSEIQDEPTVFRKGGEDELMKRRNQIYAFWALACIFAAPLEGFSMQPPPDNVTPDGTILIKDLSVPLSSLLSQEAHAYMLHLLRDRPFEGGPNDSDIKAARAFQDKIMNGFLVPIRARYSVNVSKGQSQESTPTSSLRKTVLYLRTEIRFSSTSMEEDLPLEARTAALVESIQ